MQNCPQETESFVDWIVMDFTSYHMCRYFIHANDKDGSSSRSHVSICVRLPHLRVETVPSTKLYVLLGVVDSGHSAISR